MNIKLDRDIKVDIIRGCAAILVVIGHVMQRFQNCTDSILFNVIFSIQMPLFMMVSGYVRNYSKMINSAKGFCLHIKKRLKNIMLPWLCWSLIACLILWKMPIKTYARATVFHMEMAFWFLFSLFSIDLVFSIAELFSSFLCKNNRSIIGKRCIFLCIWGGELVILLVIGKIMGITFLGIKYSVYYSFFYFAGFLFFHIKESNKCKSFFNINVRELMLFCLICLYTFLITRYNVYNMQDHSIYIFIRLIISLSGCLIVFEVIDRASINQKKFINGLQEIGRHSLELYVVQIFVVRFLKCDMYNILTIEGFSFFLVYFMVVFFISLVIIWLLNQSMLARMFLFGK